MSHLDDSRSDDSPVDDSRISNGAITKSDNSLDFTGLHEHVAMLTSRLRAAADALCSRIPVANQIPPDDDTANAATTAYYEMWYQLAEEELTQLIIDIGLMNLAFEPITVSTFCKAMFEIVRTGPPSSKERFSEQDFTVLRTSIQTTSEDEPTQVLKSYAYDWWNQSNIDQTDLPPCWYNDRQVKTGFLEQLVKEQVRVLVHLHVLHV
ncbi:hypothetical protein BDN72DRAFT_906819 [Pluteus cervinus]|uniref:Uncharacterized protein n=1 Tax=Pluteus cervinus TaxID=181527 RepID=A0ACD2ZYV0_9AGAR|nr:hypothetical protein BDN72DRAFT_906819 [Pluteus cervinus]